MILLKEAALWGKFSTTTLSSHRYTTPPTLRRNLHGSGTCEAKILAQEVVMVKRFLSLIVLLILTILTTEISAQIHISGPQSGTLIDTVYIVDGEISVGQGSSLNIEPGASFLFGAFSFQIQGLLRAIGTEEDSIIFKPDSGIAAWHGIKFATFSSDSCLLQYCLIEGSNDNGIMIHSKPTIDHCTIRRNKGNPSSFGCGIYVNCGMASHPRNPLISNCLITENSGELGGGIGIFPGNATITNCIITKNRVRMQGGGIHLEMHCSATIDHCLIAENIARGGAAICVLDRSHAVITNCTIVHNSDYSYSGCGGIYVPDGSSASIVNVIVAYNTMGGVYLPHNAGTNVIYGCIYHNHGNDFMGSSPDSLGRLVMVNANGDSCDIYHNIIMNPQFVDLQNRDYHLQANSPCIDAGDPRTPLDPDSTIADIGAFYFDQGMFASLYTDSWQPLQFGVLTNYPNPFNASTQISYSLTNDSQIELTISNILGQRVATLIDGFQEAGTHHIIWDSKDVASGIYFARLQSRDQIKTIKMVLMK